MIKVLFVRLKEKVDKQKILKLSENSPSLMFVELLCLGWLGRWVGGAITIFQENINLVEIISNKIFAGKCCGKPRERNRSKVNQASNPLVVSVLSCKESSVTRFTAGSLVKVVQQQLLSFPSPCPALDRRRE